MLLLLAIGCESSVVTLGNPVETTPTEGGDTAETVPPSQGGLDIQFDPPSGTFETTVSVILDVGTAEAHYTSDGSVPDARSERYEGGQGWEVGSHAFL